MIHIFIINSNAGSEKFSASLRNHLSNIKNIRYYILHTRKNQRERELVRQVMELFEGEYIRIYSCGGSGTFCNILNGVSDYSNVEFAFYPKGFTNDFLKVFNEDRQYFDDIDNLIDGDVVPIDYIQTNHGVCLNTFSIGLDSVQVKKMDEYRLGSVFGRDVPYIAGLIYAIFSSKPEKFEISIDGEDFSCTTSQIFFGNGGTIGGSLNFERNPEITDGMAVYSVCNAMNTARMIPCLINLMRKKNEKIASFSRYGHARSITVRRSDGLPFSMDFDGELQPEYREWKAEIVRRGINFVIPKGVSVR